MHTHDERVNEIKKDERIGTYVCNMHTYTDNVGNIYTYICIYLVILAVLDNLYC